jgi:lysophospholipase L1-like esterase
MIERLRYLALGDSYTIGESVDAAGRWPHQLVALLRQRGLPFDEPLIIARTGWTTDELSSAIDETELTPPYDLVSLLIGVNNQYRGRPVEEYRSEFTGLLDRALGFSGLRPERLFVLSIPDWGVTPFAASRDREAIAREIDRYNETAAGICRSAGVSFFDVTGSSRQHPELIASDGLHPSRDLYTIWAELVERELAPLCPDFVGDEPRSS